MTSRLVLAHSGGAVDLATLAQHGNARLPLAEQAAISNAYRTALTGCFMLSGAVMTAAFILVLGLKERMLRSEIAD